jgi:hypothetical protein
MIGRARGRAWIMRMVRGQVKPRKRGRKIQCSICRRWEECLMYEVPGWWVCVDCFEKADAMAAKEDRWSKPRDFLRLKNGPPPMVRGARGWIVGKIVK